MAGSGKSVLASEVLRDPEITLKYFPDGVFWFRVGMIDQEKMLNKLKILLEKLNASSSSNVSTVEFALELLRKQFINRYKNSLLILDDVWSSNIIQQFEICAKVMVTTRDKSVMEVTSNAKVMTLSSGFSLNESLEVLCTMWKFQDFCITQILREINFVDSRCAKTAILGAVNFVHLVNFSLQKVQKFIKIKIQSL